MVTISKDACGRYFAAFMCVKEIEKLPATNKGLGIDLGIKDILVDSNGWKSGNPRNLRKRIRRLKMYNRRLSRTKKKSNRRKKARYLVAKQHTKVADARRDWIQKQTTALIKRADVIALEDLNVKGMIKNNKLAGAISDVGISEIRRQLEYKAKWYGRDVIVIDRFAPTSKVCSECGHLMNEMPLSIQKWECPNCGAIHDRDTNAARNILALATGGRLVRNARDSRIEKTIGCKKPRGRKQPGADCNLAIGKRASGENCSFMRRRASWMTTD